MTFNAPKHWKDTQQGWKWHKCWSDTVKHWKWIRKELMCYLRLWSVKWNLITSWPKRSSRGHHRPLKGVGEGCAKWGSHQSPRPWYILLYTFSLKRGSPPGPPPPRHPSLCPLLPQAGLPTESSPLSLTQRSRACHGEGSSGGEDPLGTALTHSVQGPMRTLWKHTNLKYRQK